MITSFEIQVGTLVLIALVYALFDVLNERNIPNSFVYATLILGLACAFLFNYDFLSIDLAIAAVVGAFGYLLYRSGLLGGGDVVEFVFVSLIMPFQQMPFLTGLNQFYIPFIISVLIASGGAGIVFIPIYYLGIKSSGERWAAPTSRNIGVAAVMILAYLAFLLVLEFVLRLGIVSAFIVVLLGAASAATVLYERQIYNKMVRMIYPGELEEGDMIAVNLMSKADLKFFGRKSSFGRLATKRLMDQLVGVRRKIPVYKDSVPFALFVFIGIVISLLFGNIIILILGI